MDGIEMNFSPEQRLAMAVATAQGRIDRLESDQAELREHILGNGDPKKGLIWLAANQGELLTTLSNLLTAQARALDEHKREGHPVARQGFGDRLKEDAVRQVVMVFIGSVVAAILVAILLGTLTWFRNGGHF